MDSSSEGGRLGDSDGRIGDSVIGLLDVPYNNLILLDAHWINLMFLQTSNYSNQKYDAILTISGGGLIPSRLLRTHLNIPIYSVGISFYVGEEMKKQPIIFQWLRDSEMNFLKDKRILIVDELSDTMGTLNLLVNQLVDKGFKPENLGIAVLYDKRKKKRWSH